MQTKFLRSLLVVLCVFSSRTCISAEEKLPLIVKEDFENGMSRWETSDPKGEKSVWKIIEVGAPGNHALRCTGKSKYEPKYRSPLSFALLKDIKVTDFELTA